MYLFNIKYCLILLGSLALGSCGVSKINFDQSKLNRCMIGDSFSLLYADYDKYLSDSLNIDEPIRMSTEFHQIFINKDNYGQLKLVPDFSGEESIFPVNGNKHKLYLYFYKGKYITCALLLSVGLNTDGSCFSIGPAYIGELSDGLINFEFKVKLKKLDNLFFLNYRKAKPVDLRFSSPTRLIRTDTIAGKPVRVVSPCISVDKIVATVDNIPPDYLIFDLKKIFKQSNGLVFTIDN